MKRRNIVHTNMQITGKNCSIRFVAAGLLRQVTSVLSVAGLLTVAMTPVAAQGAASAQVMLPTDRTVLPKGSRPEEGAIGLGDVLVRKESVPCSFLPGAGHPRRGQADRACL